MSRALPWERIIEIRSYKDSGLSSLKVEKILGIPSSTVLRVWSGESRTESPEDRFWRFVQKTNTCWLWTGVTTNKRLRYGRFRYNGKDIIATHFSWFLKTGEFPQRPMEVCHSCDNPPCVNPDHLWLGTRTDNMRDASEKGRLLGQSQTHCKRGHEFDSENTLMIGNRRACRECQRIHRQRHEQKRKDEKNGITATTE